MRGRPRIDKEPLAYTHVGLPRSMHNFFKERGANLSEIIRKSLQREMALQQAPEDVDAYLESQRRRIVAEKEELEDTAKALKEQRERDALRQELHKHGITVARIQRSGGFVVRYRCSNCRTHDFDTSEQAIAHATEKHVPKEGASDG